MIKWPSSIILICSFKDVIKNMLAHVTVHMEFQLSLRHRLLDSFAIGRVARGPAAAPHIFNLKKNDFKLWIIVLSWSQKYLES